MDDGWDLHAVVRSCATTTTTTTASSAAAAGNTPAAMDLPEDGGYWSEMRGNENKLISGKTLTKKSGGLVEVYKESCAAVATSTAAAASSSISFDDGRSAHEQPSMFNNFISFSTINPVESEHHARKRKYKNNKRVVEMREEELGNDGWAWRKYGQKPIKDSPYPRCSTSKDCLARKHVDRSLADASSFIVSYSGDHLHPRPTHHSSLAGTTRSTKFNVVVAGLSEQPPCSSPMSTSSFSPTTSLKEDETDEDIHDLINDH